MTLLTGVNLTGLRIGLLANAPAASSQSANSGAPGDSITIIGTNLQNAISVIFPGDVATTITFNDATTLTFDIPVGGSGGAVHIITPNGEFNIILSVIAPPPSVTYTKYFKMEISTYSMGDTGDPDYLPLSAYRIKYHDNESAPFLLGSTFDQYTQDGGSDYLLRVPADYHVGAGNVSTWASGSVPPMPVLSTATCNLPESSSCNATQFYFPAEDTDQIWVTGFNLPTGLNPQAGTITVVVGTSDTIGKRYQCTVTTGTDSPSTNQAISITRLSDLV